MGFPHLPRPLNFPWNYGYDKFFLENCLLDLRLILYEIKTTRVEKIAVFTKFR